MIMRFLRFSICNKMDTSHLITHKDTHDTIKSTHRFIIGNMIAIVVILLGSVGWIFYAQHAKIWPYKPYIRKTGPHGTVDWSAYIKNHPATDTPTPTTSNSGNTTTSNSGNTTTPTPTTSNNGNTITTSNNGNTITTSNNGDTTTTSNNGDTTNSDVNNNNNNLEP